MSRILITSALPYINGSKHLGNLVGSMLPADLYARFERARGNDVLFICATDEHGTPAELAAAAAGQPVDVYCREHHEHQRRVAEAFGLSWDWFGRSSSPQNRVLTQHFAAVLEDQGLVEERLDQMVYSIDDERFLPDRYIEGICPYCAFEKARGDQCDNCGNLLDPVQLKSPYSVISGSRRLEVRDTRHLYLLQSKMQTEIRAWVEASSASWSPLTKSIALKHLNGGLIDRGITRDLSWGVPVARDGQPRPGFENKVFYVWFDAPIEYIAATQEWAEANGQDWRPWWRTDIDPDVRYVQVMGKDNVTFHTVSFPVTLLGSKEPWRTVHQLKALNWLNWYGGKFSTSNRRGVFMDDALDLLPADYWRWYLLANVPESADTAFTWEQFQACVNKDLADVLGNFVNRILKFTETRFDGVIPAPLSEPGPLEAALVSKMQAQLAELTAALEAIEIRRAAQALRQAWVLGNEYLQEAAPWTAIKADRDRAALIVRTGLGLVALYSKLCAPFIPQTAAVIAGSIGEVDTDWPDGDTLAANLQSHEAGRPIKVPDVLFPKVEDGQIEIWAQRFGGVAES